MGCVLRCTRVAFVSEPDPIILAPTDPNKLAATNAFEHSVVAQQGLSTSPVFSPRGNDKSSGRDIEAHAASCHWLQVLLFPRMVLLQAPFATPRGGRVGFEVAPRGIARQLDDGLRLSYLPQSITTLPPNNVNLPVRGPVEARSIRHLNPNNHLQHKRRTSAPPLVHAHLAGEGRPSPSQHCTLPPPTMNSPPPRQP